MKWQHFVRWFPLKASKQQNLKFRILLLCNVCFSLKRTIVWIQSWCFSLFILGVYLAFCQHVVSEAFLLNHWKCQHFPSLPRMPSVCVWRVFDTVLISPQTVVAKRCQTFPQQVDLWECSVELKCVSVHFKWPCWSLRCLVKPVKMACLPSPGSYRCRKSIICIGCNLDNCAEPWTTVPRAQYHGKDSVVPAGLKWLAYCVSHTAWYHDLALCLSA